MTQTRSYSHCNSFFPARHTRVAGGKKRKKRREKNKRVFKTWNAREAYLYREIQGVPQNFIAGYRPTTLSSVPVPRGSAIPLPPIRLTQNDEELDDLEDYVDALEDEPIADVLQDRASDVARGVGHLASTIGTVGMYGARATGETMSATKRGVKMIGSGLYSIAEQMGGAKIDMFDQSGKDSAVLPAATVSGVQFTRADDDPDDSDYEPGMEDWKQIARDRQLDRAEDAAEEARHDPNRTLMVRRLQ